jgi:hypothetical protein
MPGWTLRYGAISELFALPQQPPPQKNYSLAWTLAWPGLHSVTIGKCVKCLNEIEFFLRCSEKLETMKLCLTNILSHCILRFVPKHTG